MLSSKMDNLESQNQPKTPKFFFQFNLLVEPNFNITILL